MVRVGYDGGFKKKAKRKQRREKNSGKKFERGKKKPPKIDANQVFIGFVD